MKESWEAVARTDKSEPTPGQTWQLCLYVAGAGARGQLAETNVRRYCEANLAGRYSLEVIDLTQNPELARREQLVALPLLVRQLPSPRRYLLGTLTNEAQLLSSLAIGSDY